MCDLSEDLLEWYDHNAREMPWRVGPSARKAGKKPNPYYVWLSEIMLQQTTVAAVRAYFEAFVSRWPTVTDLAAAPDEDVMAAWAGLGYYARARNLLKCARHIVSDFGGTFPTDHAALLKLPGIGPYTAGAIASIAFDQPCVVVDGNVERVMARLHNVHIPLPKSKGLLTEHARELTPRRRPGDYAQAVMDLGATICTPKKPACGLCPLRSPCKARAAGTELQLPKKTPKKPKPTRHGIAYLVRREDGAWLLERRPETGLLGGMLGWPTTAWVDISEPLTSTPPLDADWKDLSGDVRHTFTHFHLILRLKFADVTPSAEPETGHFIPLSEFRPKDLPTLMRKAFDMARPSL